MSRTFRALLLVPAPHRATSSLVDRPGGTATNAEPSRGRSAPVVQPGAGRPHQRGVGRTAAEPLAAEFRYRGKRRSFVIGNRLQLQGRRRSDLRPLPGAAPSSEVQLTEGPAERRRTRGVRDAKHPRHPRPDGLNDDPVVALGDLNDSRRSRRPSTCSSGAPTRGPRAGRPLALRPAGRALQLRLPGQRPGAGPHPRQPGAAPARPSRPRRRAHQRRVQRPGLRPRPADHAARRTVSPTSRETSTAT